MVSLLAGSSTKLGYFLTTHFSNIDKTYSFARSDLSKTSPNIQNYYQTDITDDDQVENLISHLEEKLDLVIYLCGKYDNSGLENLKDIEDYIEVGIWATEVIS